MLKPLAPSSLAFLYLALAACSAQRGTQPLDMSQQAHESSASQHAQEATSHSGQYDPSATTAMPDCDQYLGSCWPSNPTDEHRKQAEEHRQVADSHRAASRALVDAEVKACQGVSESDRDISPFLHREAIAEVRPLTVPRAVTQEPYDNEFAGATIVLLPAAGVTAERLERVVQCHIARSAARGNDLREMAYCPLVPKGASAEVTSTGNGFAVNITGAARETRAEILRRAQALLSR